MMTIQQTTTVQFDNEAERRRILAAFNFGPLQDKLLKILTHFENKELEEAAALLSTMKRDEQEYLHWTIVDVILAKMTKPHITVTIL